jgi:quercetin dioxygenase-like cupin family protein
VVIQVIRGRLELTLGHDHTSAAPGCWVHLPAKLPHAVRATEPSIMLLTMLPDPGQPAPDAGPDQ